MRKIAVLLTVALLASVVMPGTAVAKTRSHRRHVHVKASAHVAKKSGSPKSVIISSKASRAGRAVVTIYKNKKVVRRITTSGKAKKRTVKWNLKDKRGHKVASGKYTYKVRVVSGSAIGTVQGAVKISKPGRTKPSKPVVPVVTEPAPVPEPAPVIEPVPSVEPAPVVEPAPAVEPAPVEPAPSVEPTVVPVVTEPAPVPEPTVTPTPVPVPVPAPTTPSTERWVGYYVPGAPAEMSPLTTVEAAVGAKAHTVNFFISDAESFPLSRVQNVANHGSIPLVTLEFWSTQTGGLAAFNSGSKDAYLHSFARAAKNYGNEVWLRPFHEMNGNWYPWGGTVGTNTPAQTVAAWKHVKDIFTAEGATNVKFVWCVNNDSVPATAANSYANYWPGDDYVDYLSIDGYNFGTYASWSSWRSFGSTMGTAYAAVTKLSNDPVIIGETASNEAGGDKAAWITDMFAKIPTNYPRIVGIVWFNANKECDWRVTSSTATLAAFKAGVAAF